MSISIGERGGDLLPRIGGKQETTAVEQFKQKLQELDPEFDAKLDTFLGDCQIDPSHKPVIEELMHRGSQILKQIHEAPIGSGMKPAEKNDLLAIDWFFRAVTILKGQEFGKGSMKIPDPDGKLADFLLTCKGVGKNGKSTDPYGRWCSHWEEMQGGYREKSYDHQRQ